MRKFVKDYKDLSISTLKFYKDHWLGCILVNILTVGGMITYFNGSKIKAKLKEKFHKEDKES